MVQWYDGMMVVMTVMVVEIMMIMVITMLMVLVKMKINVVMIPVIRRSFRPPDLFILLYIPFLPKCVGLNKVHEHLS